MSCTACGKVLEINKVRKIYIFLHKKTGENACVKRFNPELRRYKPLQFVMVVLKFGWVVFFQFLETIGYMRYVVLAIVTPIHFKPCLATT